MDIVCLDHGQDACVECRVAQRNSELQETVRCLENFSAHVGLGYPLGPLAWGDRLGAARVLAILERMLELSGDPRYRPSPWLRRRARLGVSLATAEPAL